MRLSTFLAPFALATTAIAAPDGSRPGLTKLDDTLGGGFVGELSDHDLFGVCVAPIGDFDGDGISDVAIGVPFDDDGGPDHGAIWLVFLNADGTVKDKEKLEGPSGVWDEFGQDIVGLGDLDGNGVWDLAVGTQDDYVHVLLLNPDGSLRAHVPIDGGNYAPAGSDFGMSVGATDFDLDGRRELVVGAPGDGKGALYVFSLTSVGTIVTDHRISESDGGFSGELTPASRFGRAVAGARDVDLDGTPDLVVTNPLADEGTGVMGAVWVLFMQPDGTVRDHQKISGSSGNFNGSLAVDEVFGVDVSTLGDFDESGTPDLLVTSPGENGTVWMLFLNPDGTVRAHLSHSALDFKISGGEAFGASVCMINDLDGDGVDEIVVGAPGNDGGGTLRGGAYVLFPHEAIRGARIPYGCDLNPAGSLVATTPPAIGTTMLFEVHNPLGTQAHEETLPLLVASLNGAGECGVGIGGWHMDPSQPNGELLVLPPFELTVLGDAWFGQPVTVGLPIPNDPCLMGTIGYVQAAMVDFSDDAVVPIALTTAWKLRLGT